MPALQLLCHLRALDGGACLGQLSGIEGSHRRLDESCWVELISIATPSPLGHNSSPLPLPSDIFRPLPTLWELQTQIVGRAGRYTKVELFVAVRLMTRSPRSPLLVTHWPPSLITYRAHDGCFSPRTLSSHHLRSARESHCPEEPRTLPVVGATSDQHHVC